MPTTESAVPFPPVGYAAWRAGVEAELGADAVTRRLRATTEDGIGIEPLYAPGGPGDEQARNLADRVVGLLPAAGQGWRIRQRFPVGTAANVLRAALEGGVQSLEFEGDEHDKQLERMFRSLEELDSALLRGIEFSFEGVIRDDGTGIDFPNNPASLGDDPIGRWLRVGGSLDKSWTRLVRHRAIRPVPDNRDFKLYRATGEPFNDAGATAGMTLGATMAVALTYLRSMEDEGRDGVDMAWAASRIEMRLPCGARFFESAAMLRAARLVWARVLEVSGIASTPLCLVASTGRRSLTRHDPWNNALRNTAVAFAAAIGGADVLQLLPHDSRTADPGDAALRLARTTGLILREEASLGRVMDPAEGSWFLESLTSSLAEEAWEELRRLDAAGGIITAIESGDLGRRIADAAGARHERVLDKRHPIIGVSEHPVAGEVARRSQHEIVEAAAGGLLPFRPDALPYEVLRDGEMVR